MKIVVIGAGISGLTFAAAIQRFAPQIEVEVYERDQSLTSRPQGYSLGLKGDAGLAVLKTLGLYEQIAAEVATITNFVFCNQRGQRLLELPATGDERHLTQRVRREALKMALFRAAPPASVHLGRPCTADQQNAEGIEALFEDGTSVQADYLIVCDGVSSAVRQHVLGDVKRYLGLTAIFGEAPVTIQHPLLQGGYFLMLGDDGTSCFCYRQPDSIHMSYVVSAQSEEDLRVQAPDKLLHRVQHATGAWHPPGPELVAAIDPASVGVRGYDDRDPITRGREGRIWLIGDAAHPMSPFQGQGANMGMLDSLKLAKLFAELASSPELAAEKVEALEKDIVSRGRQAVLDSRAAAKRFQVTNPLQQRWRNFGFRVGNTFIQMFSHEEHDSWKSRS
jgi:salicylate hydroxylase